MSNPTLLGQFDGEVRLNMQKGLVLCDTVDPSANSHV